MAHAGTLHKYSKKLVAFEHSSTAPSNASVALNTLIWIGGLGDGLLTVTYPTDIASSLPSQWVIAEIVLRSSYNGWATGRLSRDAREIGECVTYFRNLRPGKKVILMGHSTGCQDIMEYLVGPDAKNQPPVDGAILQGGVSDREAWEDMMETEEQKILFQKIVDQAKEMIDNGDERGILPVKGNTVAEELGAPITAYRTYSLLSKGGDDDYFSSDLSDEHFQTTFGKIPQTTPLCFLLGSEDPYVPTKINKKELLQRWTRIVREGGGTVDDENGGVIDGAHHNLVGDPEEVVQDLVKRVIGFTKTVEKHSESGQAGSRL
jgi:pimeloyl-ACP methyl ester carboxylesterase